MVTAVAMTIVTITTGEDWCILSTACSAGQGSELIYTVSQVIARTALRFKINTKTGDCVVVTLMMFEFYVWSHAVRTGQHQHEHE